MRTTLSARIVGIVEIDCIENWRYWKMTALKNDGIGKWRYKNVSNKFFSNKECSKQIAILTDKFLCTVCYSAYEVMSDNNLTTGKLNQASCSGVTSQDSLLLPNNALFNNNKVLNDNSKASLNSPDCATTKANPPCINDHNDNIDEDEDYSYEELFSDSKYYEIDQISMPVTNVKES